MKEAMTITEDVYHVGCNEFTTICNRFYVDEEFVRLYANNINVSNGTEAWSPFYSQTEYIAIPTYLCGAVHGEKIGEYVYKQECDIEEKTVGGFFSSRTRKLCTPIGDMEISFIPE